MTPKFRGDSDDWLDDEGKGSARRSKAPVKSKRTRSAATETNATVTEVFPNQCRVSLDAGKGDLLCAYRRAEFLHASSEPDEYRERSPVAVGDRVQVSPLSEGQGVVEAVAERENSLFRLAPGRDSKKIRHVIAANVDQLLVVASVTEPDFSAGLVDRYLVAAQLSKIPALLCVTKIDLLSSQQEKSTWKIYQDLGVRVFEVSGKRGDGIDHLRSEVLGKTIVFCGHSGVGKTSLLRALLKQEIGKIAEISSATGKGRHTTTSSVLWAGPDGSRWIDTPGVREFSVSGILPEQLHHYFPEFSRLRCAQSGCLHLTEANCQARALPRHASYLRLFESLREA